jgi:hypothetical protein
MVLTTKIVYLVFWYRYLAVHIFTAFTISIPESPTKSKDYCYIKQLQILLIFPCLIVPICQKRPCA